ncbi:MAG: phosphate acyltransferase [Ferrovum sp. 37-45-19]|uniref:phosphate acyltransferase PlsX n=1 Tax=Ferrovum sp. JA12 TaxID=1356299 RepID=UPI0007028F52|nr:phosphate acyltransferase PlsX [Ferrovum sp. JA12]OYV80337.1 MAG: phosphate acyltransferase [Ferrovum sp. 21-44-67]OYV95081.1 MAG: phosphate acyltransferase [Ferrovum sp. 37-45-19]OZB31806.1 MAG: phosphate acyltransferase [Ferrovum sp. 34-44-207]HQT80855.1 phosphate acyltransferase PlsX [Ferrovaceae bacterium]KRH78696.1 phosphate acyltransferase [Ferrovum sp. JA12]
MTVTVAVDVMGGDIGIDVTIPAALDLLALDSEVNLILVGSQDLIEQKLKRLRFQFSPRLLIQHASEVVSMDEAPALVLKKKKDSSMRVAINLVKEGRAHACVSAGNTGALMATARFVLKMMPGIERPAIATKMPSIKGHVYVLDLGANVDCDAEHLQQFGIMGSTLCSAIEGIERPTVGLLNIGHEAIKGGEVIKHAAQLLAISPINFYGNIEGDDIFRGTVNVVVCDGFVGNVVLKTSEGLAWMLSQMIKNEFKKNIFTRLAAIIAMPVLNSFRKKVDHRRYNGASLLGLRGLVVKSHGGADAYAFRNALQYAVSEYRNNIIERIEATINSIQLPKHP